MKNTTQALLLFLLTLAACVRTDTPKQPEINTPPAEASEMPLLCEIKELPADVVKPRGVGYRGHYWNIGQTITVGFPGPSNPGREAQVRQHAPAWAQWAMINLRFVPKDSAILADLRVRFDNSGNWSYIGTDAKFVSRQSQTINIGQDDPTGRIIKHEFGHALGLKHEQSHPNGICWNKPQVYADALRFYGWGTAMVDNNILYVASPDAHDITPFDTASVMLYDIPKTWNYICTGPNCTNCTGPGRAYIGGNTISAGDITTIKSIYPGRGGPVDPPITGDFSLALQQRKDILTRVQGFQNAAQISLASATAAKVAADSAVAYTKRALKL